MGENETKLPESQERISEPASQVWQPFEGFRREIDRECVARCDNGLDRKTLQMGVGFTAKQVHEARTVVSGEHSGAERGTCALP
jgi:hypothetical protein